MKYDIIWRVEEIVNGPGHHDKGVRDGDHRTLAEGKVQKEGASEVALRAELTEVLEKSFPRHAFGPTYDLDCIYHITITEVKKKGISMPQTPEDRIRLHYRALRKRWDRRDEGFGLYWLLLARTWKRPVQEIKAIIKGKNHGS